MKSRPTKQKLKQRGILKERVFGCDLGEHLLNSGFEGNIKLYELMVLVPDVFGVVSCHQSLGRCGDWCVPWFSSAPGSSPPFWVEELREGFTEAF